MSHMQIRDTTIGDGAPTYIIAEIGINHDGDVAKAIRLIDAAAAAGTDAIKFQTIDPQASYAPGTPSRKIFAGRTLTEDEYYDVVDHTIRRGLTPLTTPGDLPSLALAQRVGFPGLKISSGLLTNLPLVRAAAGTGAPLVISTGFSYPWEVARALQVARDGGATDVALLHCVSLYPTPDEAVGLSAIGRMKDTHKIPIGYSDHSVGSLACLGAVASGAKLIEKHLMLDNDDDAPDAAVSATPDVFATLVKDIRRLEAMMHRDGTHPHDDEILARPSMHRCLVAARDLAEGDVLGPDDIHLKRPASTPGIGTEFLDVVIGRRTVSPIAKDKPLRWEALMRT